ncbi:unnamed protein product [Closterium sp. NIES-64]|nr:unnamed protein product [Closterium sp. NIES-64]
MKGVAFLLLLHACLASHRLAAAGSRRELQASCPANVVCPTGASCVVDGSGYPYCKCAAGQAIINGVCAPTASWAEVGTNVVLYNAANYANSPTTLGPAVLRGAAPNSSACVNLSGAFNGSVGSLRIMWNVNDGVADHLVCGKLFFWDKPNCCCSGSGYQIPGGWSAANPNNFSYASTSVKTTSGIILTARSISCQAAIATNTYPCATKTCPVNATCSVVNGAAVCTCNAGYSMVGGQCVATPTDPCTGYTCPANSACSNVNGVATCTCNTGYQMVNGQCVVPDPCTGYTCPANSACSNVNGVATCTCNTGYQMVNGQCVVPDPCATANCPLNSVCSNVNGVATCTCSAGFQMVNGQCAALPPSDPCASTTCQANANCSVVNGAATCTCLPGFDPVNGACIVITDPCASTTCPAKATCSNVNGVATCVCAVGYTLVSGACQPAAPCSLVTCPANCTCSSANGVSNAPTCPHAPTCSAHPSARALRPTRASSTTNAPPVRAAPPFPSSPPALLFSILPTLLLPMLPAARTAVFQALLTPSLPHAPPSFPPLPPRLAPGRHAATLANSDYLDNQNAARAAVGAIPLVWNASRECPPRPPSCLCLLVWSCAYQRACCAPCVHWVVALTSHAPSAPTACTSSPLLVHIRHCRFSDPNPHPSLVMSQPPSSFPPLLVPLVLVPVAAEAQAWATTLTNSTYNCGLSHGGNPGEGQNLSGGGPAGYYSNGAAVSWWVGEGDLYTYAVFSGGCSTGNWADCGHYTQVIWNNTRTVGCGKASCGTKADVWACNYYPPGNYGGQLPYVQDPCYRVACPSTATCTVQYGQPVCVCGAGQVLVNNATCQPDPCSSGTITCPGNLVCDGSSGTAQCACPTGLVAVSADTCVPPACVGAVCPAQATCAVDGSGYPFCQCPTGWYLGSNVCVQGTPAAVSATSLAIYNTASYSSTPPALGPTLVRTGLPANSSRGSCVDIPGGIAAASLRVLWNVPDSMGAPKQSCGLLWFWTSASCYGSATGYYRPAGDVTNFATTSGNVALVKAIACAM